MLNEFHVEIVSKVTDLLKHPQLRHELTIVMKWLVLQPFYREQLIGFTTEFMRDKEVRQYLSTLDDRESYLEVLFQDKRFLHFPLNQRRNEQ